VAPALAFAFYFFLLFLFIFNPDFDCRNHKSPFLPGKIEKFMRPLVKFMKAIERNPGFTIAFKD